MEKIFILSSLFIFLPLKVVYPGLEVLFNNQPHNRSIVYAAQAKQKRAVDPSVIDAFKKNKEYYDAILKDNIPQRNPFLDETFAKVTDPDAVTLELDNQCRIIIPRNIARECETISNVIDDCKTNSIPLPNQFFLTRDTLKKLFLCMKDKTKCSTIPTTDLQNVLLAADYLQCQNKDHLQIIGLQAHKELSEEQLLPATKNFNNKLFETQITNDNIIKDKQLRIVAEKLINLDVLAKIPDEVRKNITGIWGAHNYLKKLDFDRLKELFPNLEYVDFSYNSLNKINGKKPLYITKSDPSLLFSNYGFKADLSYNRLEDVPIELLTAANLQLNLDKNYISPEVCKKILDIKAPLLQKYSTIFKSSTQIKKESWDVALGGLTAFISSLKYLIFNPNQADCLSTITLTGLSFAMMSTGVFDIYNYFMKSIPGKDPFITLNNQLQPQLKPITVNRNSNFMMFKPNGLRDMRSNNL